MPQCANGHLLDEPDSLPVEQRQPCLQCGSPGRIFARTASDAALAADSVSAVVIRPATIATAAEVPTPVIMTTEEIVETLNSIGRRVNWYRPTDDHDLWMVEVYDDAGTLLGSGVGDNREDALLGIAEDILPRDDE